MRATLTPRPVSRPSLKSGFLERGANLLVSGLWSLLWSLVQYVVEGYLDPNRMRGTAGNLELELDLRM